MSHVKTVPLTEEEEEKLKCLYKAHRDLGQRYVKTIPGNQILAYTFEKFKDDFANFNIRNDDVFVFGWPKNGSVWLAEMVWCIRNKCDVSTAKALSAHQRYPFIEFAIMAEAFKHVFPLDGFTNIIQQLDKMESPRTIRSHLCFDLMPCDMLEKSKVFVVIRNPKDTIVSYFHHEQLLKLFDFNGDFSSYFENFMDGHVAWGPYWEYTKDVWKKRHHPNLCLLFYEDMKKDLKSCISKVANFLQIQLSKDDVKLLEDHLSFRTMQSNKSVNLEAFRDLIFNNIEGGKFMRKGEVGDWRNYFTEDMSKRVDDAVAHHFQGLGLNFTYQL